VAAELAGAGRTIQRQVAFGDTKGWGAAAPEWGLAEMPAGDMDAGPWSLQLTAQADNSDITLDGFWILPPSVKIAPEEFSTLQRLQIGPDGYLGLRVCSGILNQQTGGPLVVVTRNFTGTTGTVHASFTRASGETIELTAAGEPRAEGSSDAQRSTFTCNAIPDGPGSLKIRCAQPALSLDVPVHLAGEFLANLGGRVGKLEAFAKELPRMDEAAKEHQADFDYAVNYLKIQGLEHLRHCAAPVEGDALKYLTTTQMRPPEILLANVQNTLAQYEQTMALLHDHKNPDTDRVGDLRRCLNAKAHPVPFRLYVPAAYAHAEKTPLILVLHGANDDEDGMLSGDNAAMLRIAQRRGYILVAPIYRRNEEGYMDYLLEILAQVRSDYAKVDPQRIYVYGFSMGGNASSQIAAHHPEIFAAACSGGGFCMMDEVERLQVPVRILIGAEDPGIKGIAPRVARMLELGKTFDLHVEPGLPHTCPAEKFMNLALEFFEQHAHK